MVSMNNLTENQTEILKGMRSEIKVCESCLQKVTESFVRKNKIAEKMKKERSDSKKD